MRRVDLERRGTVGKWKKAATCKTVAKDVALAKSRRFEIPEDPCLGK